MIEEALKSLEGQPVTKLLAVLGFLSGLCGLVVSTLTYRNAAGLRVQADVREIVQTHGDIQVQLLVAKTASIERRQILSSLRRRSKNDVLLSGIDVALKNESKTADGLEGAARTAAREFDVSLADARTRRIVLRNLQQSLASAKVSAGAGPLRLAEMQILISSVEEEEELARLVAQHEAEAHRERMELLRISLETQRLDLERLKRGDKA